MTRDYITSGKEPIVNGPVEMDSEPAVDPQAQPGIQNIEAVTMVWSTSALVAAYIMIWLIYFVEGLVMGTQTALTPYVTSAFAEHSLTPTISIVSYVIGGATNFTIAKILDVFGRPQGLLLCIIIASLGLVMMASCTHVEAYAAALVFYTVGNTGLQYTLSVFVADTSSLLVGWAVLSLMLSSKVLDGLGPLVCFRFWCLSSLSRSLDSFGSNSARR
jgi:hypothetical protein